MPTAAKMVAAILWGGIAWYVSTLVIPLLPEGTQIGWFVEVNTALGLFAGWSVAGPRAGQGFNGAIGYGITATVALVVLALFTHSVVEMVYQSLDKRYGSPGEAVIAVFEHFVDFGKLLLDKQVLTVLAIGGIVAGLVTEATGRRWS